MSSRPRRFAGTRPFVALLVSAMLGAVLTAPSTAVAVEDPRPDVGGSADRAEAVLKEAQSLFDGGPTSVGPDRDATMILRDLSIVRTSLQGRARLAADRLLARPTATKVSCTATACFHWSETGFDKVDPADSNGIADGDGVPDYVEQVTGAVSHVQQTYVGAGYRAVKPDGNRGGNALPDIYLKNIGPDGLYGYCTSDKKKFKPGHYDAWAFCVLDNDYAPAEFPTNTPLENLQVTAAHEYFHAVQFGYDYWEDSWFMEATATWAEDEVYTDVNDNLQYLATGPLSKPSVPLDTFNKGGYQYGAWIFFRYLTEQLSDEQGGMPTLVRDMWRKADGSGAPGAPDQYSMQAVGSVLKQRGTSLTRMFAAFADGNLRPAMTYLEGLANSYPSAPTAPLGPGSYVATVDHMASATARAVPQAGATSLKVTVDMPPKKQGSAAVVSVSFLDGTVQTSPMTLTSEGNGSGTYAFDPATVKWVDVTLVNASAKYSCWRKAAYSCQGVPKFDDRRTKLKLASS